MQAERIVHCQNDLGEGPLWDTREQTLYWLDINQSEILKCEAGSEAIKTFRMPMRVTALGLRKSGGFICATEKGFHFWDGISTTLEFISHPEEGKAGARFNDGKVDHNGRFWAGTMEPKSATSALYRLDADLSMHKMEDGITISNGIGWSPDNSVMYYADTLTYTVFAYDFDLQSGAISNKRVFFKVEQDFGKPDGLTVDSQGCVWVAFYDGWKVMRYQPDGSEDLRVELPVARPTCPAFGGADLDELYFTTAIDGLSAQERKKQPQAGDLFMLKPGVKGLPEPYFKR